MHYTSSVSVTKIVREENSPALPSVLSFMPSTTFCLHINWLHQSTVLVGWHLQLVRLQDHHKWVSRISPMIWLALCKAWIREKINWMKLLSQTVIFFKGNWILIFFSLRQWISILCSLTTIHIPTGCSLMIYLHFLVIDFNLHLVNRTGNSKK